MEEPDMMIGVMGKSLRENEKRVPLHPLVLGQIPPSITRKLIFEEGYATSWGIRDEELRERGFQLATKGELYNDTDATIIAKPMLEDLWNLRAGGVLIGWLHFTLYGRLASTAIERKQTVLTFEGINPTVDEFGRRVNAFPSNGQLAGLGALHHLMGREGLHPKFGKDENICIIGYGNAGRAIAQEAINLGFSEVVCLTKRNPNDIHDRVTECRYYQYIPAPDGQSCKVVLHQTCELPMSEFLARFKVIFNCVDQDPLAPVQYFAIEDMSKFDHRCFVVDVSCDPGMGFPFSRTTTFEAPSYIVGMTKVYSVDHIPGYFWDAGTWGWTRGLLPWLEFIVQGPAVWRSHPVLSSAIEIDKGEIRNQKLIDYQKREGSWPFVTTEPQPWRRTVDRNRVELRESFRAEITM
jgi:alanine dehydrogenase